MRIFLECGGQRFKFCDIDLNPIDVGVHRGVTLGLGAASKGINVEVFFEVGHKEAANETRSPGNDDFRPHTHRVSSDEITGDTGEWVSSIEMTNFEYTVYEDVHQQSNDGEWLEKKFLLRPDSRSDRSHQERRDGICAVPEAGKGRFRTGIRLLPMCLEPLRRLSDAVGKRGVGRNAQFLFEFL